MKSYVLDANALIAFMEGRSGADRVEALFEAAESRRAAMYMTAISLGEVFYSIWKAEGEQQARRRLQQLLASPLQITAADFSEAIRAAEVKAKYRCVYADAFAASLAIGKRATLVTSDPDFKR